MSIGRLPTPATVRAAVRRLDDLGYRCCDSTTWTGRPSISRKTVRSASWRSSTSDTASAGRRCRVLPSISSANAMLSAATCAGAPAPTSVVCAGDSGAGSSLSLVARTGEPSIPSRTPARPATVGFSNTSRTSDAHARLRADTGHELRREQRVPAVHEEVGVTSEGVATEHLGHESGHRALACRVKSLASGRGAPEPAARHGRSCPRRSTEQCPARSPHRAPCAAVVARQQTPGDVRHRGAPVRGRKPRPCPRVRPRSRCRHPGGR